MACGYLRPTDNVIHLVCVSHNILNHVIFECRCTLVHKPPLASFVCVFLGLSVKRNLFQILIREPFPSRTGRKSNPIIEYAGIRIEGEAKRNLEQLIVGCVVVKVLALAVHKLAIHLYARHTFPNVLNTAVSPSPAEDLTV